MFSRAHDLSWGDGGERHVPAGLDLSRPSSARVYDYMLGGKDHFAVDRAAGELLKKNMGPGWDSRRNGLDNRAFLRRVVRYLVREVGIRQFIDIGSGLPTLGNVHEVAQESDPGARVVYVDNDPMVLVHCRALLGDSPTTKIISADLRRPETVLDHEAVRGFIDFGQPVGLLLFAIVHHLRDDERPGDIMAVLRDRLAPGSHLAISHFFNPGAERPEVAAKVLAGERIFNEKLGTGRFRHHDEILRYFGDFEPVEPGLVMLPDWRPDPDTDRSMFPGYHMFAGGVARKG
ncbi:hypothetical protein Misp01_10770 [Microtetraspora sp. NBRC 13810]|uniref:SAM-dependent methyltransferase n=1 Tax=Microtetraspora sp. NBRC 13810 TaxID=3030990 RepID=UPI0024A37758|nr:SAM-dependent methyltransferase [Microtetraspora sp. NBRC 13810]GLW05947.1 hypothetical protein Misp01_10770 [Microtetraspora sp. NBRC 13810]